MGEGLRQDVRYAFRQFRQSPGFAATAILTLSLGIGANTALFTILNALVPHELAIKDPRGLIGVEARNAQNQDRLTPITALDELSRDNRPLLVVGIGAGIVPARRAAGVDPMIALRAE